jgi:tetratricopeptide (TPR) repeat protein
MLRWIGLPCRFLRRHLLASLLITVLGIVTLLILANVWAWQQYRAAEQALREEQTDQARSHILQCLRVWGHSSATHLLAARIERLSGHYPQAEQYLQECVRLQHGPTEATRLEEKLLLAQSGDLADVEMDLWKLVEADHPQSPLILETLASVYIRDGRKAAALACLERWIQRDPQTARAWHWRGWVHEDSKNPVRAMLDYEHALELQPGRWGARMRLTGLLLEWNNLSRASVHLEELQRSHPDDVGVQTLLARYRELEGESEEAIRLLDQVLQKRPDYMEALLVRGRLACQQQHPEEGENFLRRALNLRPTHAGVLYALYQCLEQQGKDSESAPVYVRYKQLEVDARRLSALLDPQKGAITDNPNTLAEVGDLCLRLGEEKSGLMWLYRALKINPNHKATHEILLRYYEAKGNTAEAARHRQYLAHISHSSSAAASNKN